MHWVAVMVSVTVALAVILWSKKQPLRYRLMVIGTLLSRIRYSALSVYSLSPLAHHSDQKLAWVSTGTALMLLFISGTSAIPLNKSLSGFSQLGRPDSGCDCFKEVARAIAAYRAATLNALVIGTAIGQPRLPPRFSTLRNGNS